MMTSTMLCGLLVVIAIAYAGANSNDTLPLSRLRRAAKVVQAAPAAAAAGEHGKSGGYGYHQHSKKCYQCAYSPPKIVYEKHHSYGDGGHGGHGHQSYSYHHGTVHGGWDKCLGPFDHYQAKAYGVDVWDCHYNNCYVRRDHNGDIFRGCYKGEYGVNQHLYGCHYQGGSTYCFCEGELCNNGAAPH